MPVYTQHKPDPKYYVNIIQYDDGNWAADPIPVDDTTVYPPQGGYKPGTGSPGVQVPGLRTLTSRAITDQAATIVNKYAPPDHQRDALHILATQTSGSAWTNAKAMMDWVNAVNVYRDQQIAYVYTLNFNQIVAYIVPSGFPPWPAPPSGLTPVAAAKVGSQLHALRFG
jgi:hypothetical protein